MIMEILSVQNHQFGVLADRKVEDWTKPLTPAQPTKAIAAKPKASPGAQVGSKTPQHSPVRQMAPPSSKPSDAAAAHAQMLANYRRTCTISEFHSSIVRQKQPSKAGKLSKSATTPIKVQMSNQKSALAGPQGKLSKSKSSSGVLSHSGSTSTSDDSQSEAGLDDLEDDAFLYNLPTYSEDAIEILAVELEKQLREAKLKHLACTEVLLPCDLLNRIAIDMLNMSDSEPCGIRGCNIIIEFEDEPANTRRIASMKVDQNTVSTFEFYLTIKQDRSGWTSMLPQFLKNLARGGTIMISHDYCLVKNKLYYSFSD